jgi:hypothetical protein
MLEGTAAFQRLIGRWVDPVQFESWRSRPFVYAVPVTSVLAPSAVRDHLAAVDRLADAVDPVGLAPHRGWRELSRDELAEQFDTRNIAAAFQTGEFALDLPDFVQALDRALSASAVAFRNETRVDSVSPSGDAWLLAGRQDGAPFTEQYPVVVNATWEQRMRFDAPLGLGVSRQVIHRYKVGLRSLPGSTCPALPSVTFSLGSYGDTVSFAGLGGFMPQRIAELDPDPDAWQLVGGWISAWGSSGIEDPTSELHQRHDIGVHSLGTYHSIDTGKWTTAPLLAAETCARIGDPQ